MFLNKTILKDNGYILFTINIKKINIIHGKSWIIGSFILRLSYIGTKALSKPRANISLEFSLIAKDFKDP